MYLNNADGSGHAIKEAFSEGARASINLAPLNIDGQL
jgi:hypothetical protein